MHVRHKNIIEYKPITGLQITATLGVIHINDIYFLFIYFFVNVLGKNIGLLCHLVQFLKPHYAFKMPCQV